MVREGPTASEQESPTLTSVETPPLEGRRVRMRPVLPSDYNTLYSMLLHPEVACRWRYRGATPSPERFNTALWDGVHVQFIIERKSDGTVAGLQVAYNTNFRNRYTYMGTLLDPRFHRAAWPLESAAMFIDYLFKAFNLRKIYGETLDFNYSQFASGADKLFAEEARLRDHAYFGGRYWDTRIIALYRSDWFNKAPDFFNRARST
jgi:RimJ/RimL family protein N-acetyltransferase